MHTVHRNRKPCNSFFMFNMASDMDRGHVYPTMTTLHNMAAILQLIGQLRHTALVYGVHI